MLPSAGEKLVHTARESWHRGDSADAIRLLSDAIAARPRDGEAPKLLAKVLQSEGRLGAASQVLANWCAETGHANEAVLEGAQLIQQCQRQPLAAAICAKAIATGNASADLFALAGNIERELGDFAAARRHYHSALSANVDLNRWFVLGALAGITRYAGTGEADIASFIAHFEDTRFSARSRAASGFGLAKAYGDFGDFARSAATARVANALVRAVLPWSSAKWRDFVASRRREPIAPVAAADPNAGFVPVFIVGLPRSGTTLTAGRLAGFDRVRDRGELRVMGFIAERLRAANLLHDPPALREAAQLYRTHVIQDDEPARWYVDKDPLNFRHLDLIAAMFPQAKIIHCRRSLRDTALSIWVQDFAHEDCAFAYDFDSLAAYFADYDELMRHWSRTLPLEIHELNYEDMVADPEQATEVMRAFVGVPRRLGENPKKNTVITSASMWQARQPIYRTSVDRWRAYSPHLPELHNIPDR